MAPFAHSLFTTAFGIGVYFALQRTNAFGKVGCILIGYLGAVLMHGMWNGSSLLSSGAYFLVYLLWMVPIFGLAVWLGVASRRREQRIVAEKLPGMVAAGPGDAQRGDLAGLDPDQEEAVNEATRLGGKAAGKASRSSPPKWSSWRSSGTGSTAASATAGPRPSAGGGGRRRGVARHHSHAGDAGRLPAPPGRN